MGERMTLTCTQVGLSTIQHDTNSPPPYGTPIESFRRVEADTAGGGVTSHTSPSANETTTTERNE